MCILLFIGPIPNIRPRTDTTKSLTSAFGARTAVFATPTTFHTPWPRMIGAPLLALVWFRRRRRE